LEAVPKLKKCEKPAREDSLRECIEQILLTTNSEFFKLKEKICNFALTEFGKVKELRRYLDALKYKIFDLNRKNLSALVTTKDSDKDNYILGVIESIIESSCLSPLIDEIYSLLKKEAKCPRDLEKKLLLLFEKPQEFFGINKIFLSKDKWINAVAELLNFPKKVLPSEKVRCLLDTIRQIHHGAKRICRKQITADDLLPIVIFVVVRTSQEARGIVITVADELFVKSLIDPEALQDERGYYLCVFSAALEFIRNFDPEKIEERFSTFMQLKVWGFC